MGPRPPRPRGGLGAEVELRQWCPLVEAPRLCTV